MQKVLRKKNPAKRSKEGSPDTKSSGSNEKDAKAT